MGMGGTREPLKVLSLFAGIGGFDLGLERTGGFKTVAFCEIEPFAQRVLKKHWSEVPIYGDVRELTAERLRADGIAVDVICGGFPCQDISIAGKGAGLAGERSGLWSEIVRLARDIRPQFLILENVSALLARGLGGVLGDLASLGYDAEWHCIPASAVGAPHRRDRIWILAHPRRARLHERRLVGDASKEGAEQGRVERDGIPQGEWSEAASLADAECQQSRERCDADEKRRRTHEAEQTGLGSGTLADPCLGRYWLAPEQISARRNGTLNGDWWLSEPNVGRVANGIPRRVDRLRCLGNAVVPQIPELIGRAILASMEAA
jgi:DNA (cytosine-5)-methyltransferase 1